MTEQQIALQRRRAKACGETLKILAWLHMMKHHEQATIIPMENYNHEEFLEFCGDWILPSQALLIFTSVVQEYVDNKKWMHSNGTELVLPPRRVVCAACKLLDGTIICSPRHFDNILRTVAAHYEETDGATWSSRDKYQGFVDQWGIWMSREEAWVVAESQGQIRRPEGGPKGRLYSEHLY